MHFTRHCVGGFVQFSDEIFTYTCSCSCNEKLGLHYYLPFSKGRVIQFGKEVLLLFSREFAIPFSSYLSI